jgi:hypothetical protein
MRLVAGVALCLALAQPAWALSCMAPDMSRDYARAAQSDETYIVVKGDLHFDETALPDRADERQSRQRDSIDIPGWLAGRSLTADGFTKPFERDVILRVSCLGPWCGGTEKGPHLAFLKQEDRQWVMEIGPCLGMTYFDPTKAQEATVAGCFRGKTCAPK